MTGCNVGDSLILEIYTDSDVSDDVLCSEIPTPVEFNPNITQNLGDIREEFNLNIRESTQSDVENKNAHT